MRRSDTVELVHLEAEPLSKSYRERDPIYILGEPDITRRGSWRARLTGWRGGVLLAIIITAFVLLLNVTLATIAAVAWDPKDGIATAFSGDCAKAGRISTALHLLINLLGSLLLGASNYCMQRLVAPTRKEIDEAHAQKKWLDIGVPSIRNLTSVQKRRFALWVLLALSSMPLHLVYNSVVFETTSANNVALFTVATEFFTIKNSWEDRNIDYTRGHFDRFNVTSKEFIAHAQESLLDGKYMDPALFENVTGAECFDRYEAGFITTGTGYGVVNAKTRESFSLNGSDSLLFAEIGSGDLRPEKDWDYCLCEVIPSKCEVQFSTTILSLVIAANIVKVVLMVFVFWRMNEPTLVTIGDAIQSFLARPDPTTKDCCLLSRHNVDALWRSPKHRLQQRFAPRKRKWFDAISGRRWSFSIALYFSAILVAVVLYNISSRRGNPFGKVDASFLVYIRLPYGGQSIIPFVLLANLPQVVASFSYLTYNGLFTYMLANREWTGFTTKRAPLRVTIPKPGQRSTHFLQLPYTWSLPLLVASIFLHWLISQSIFLARVAIYQEGVLSAYTDDNLKERFSELASSGNVTYGLGYSDIALMVTIIWSVALVTTCLIIAFWGRYPKGLSVGGTNSAVISAACHLRSEAELENELQDGILDKPLQWGVTVPGDEVDRVGHCSFSSSEVERLVAGCLYAGLAKGKI